MERLTDDIKIYIEACIAHQKLRGNVVMLVTDDHKFFHVFARSVIAENIQPYTTFTLAVCHGSSTARTVFLSV